MIPSNDDNRMAVRVGDDCRSRAYGLHYRLH